MGGKPHDREEPLMSTDELTHGLLEVEQVGDCTIGRFTRRTILESAAIETIAARLRALVREEGFRLIVLNFARVETVTSAMLGTFLSIHKEVEASGGRVAFCNVHSFPFPIFPPS